MFVRRLQAERVNEITAFSASSRAEEQCPLVWERIILVYLPVAAAAVCSFAFKLFRLDCSSFYHLMFGRLNMEANV